MKRPITPCEKKAFAYQKDYVVRSPYSVHVFRHNWPKKRASRHRWERRKTRQLLMDIIPIHDSDDAADMALRPFRQKSIHPKWANIMPLGEWVHRCFEIRIQRTAYNLRPYYQDCVRERFVAVLESLIQGHTPYSREVARFFDRDLTPPYHKPSSTYPWVRRQPKWLEAHLNRVTKEAIWPGDVHCNPYAWRTSNPQWFQRFFLEEPAWESRLHGWIACVTQSSPAGSPLPPHHH